MPFRTPGDWIAIDKIELIKAYRDAYASREYMTNPFGKFAQWFDSTYGGNVQAFGFYINDHNGWIKQNQSITNAASLLHTKNWVEDNYEIITTKEGSMARYKGPNSAKINERIFKDLQNSWALLIVKAHSL